MARGERRRPGFRTALVRLVRHVLGWGLLVLGIAGLFLPVIQGLLCIGLGAILLAPDVPVFARLVTRIERRVPHLAAAFAKLEKWFGVERPRP